MRIPIDRHAVAPLHEQIASWVERAIDEGRLPVDHRLPSTRRLAAELGVSRSTVVTAYNALESVGLVRTREGSGTRVDRRPDHGAVRAAAVAAAEPNATASHVLSFTGVGDRRLFAVAELSRTIRDVLRQDGAQSLGYGADELGDLGLRQTVQQMLASQGIVVGVENVVITNGSQQALAVVCQTALRPGDRVVVEEPTYDNALRLFRTLGITVVSVAADATGLRLDELEVVMEQHRVGLIYTMPTFQNPTGAVMPSAHRHTLLEIASRHGALVFEDDYAADLRYDGRTLPALKAIDRDGVVLYAGSFSKLIAPAVRVGYVVGDEPMSSALARHRHDLDLGTSLLMQRVLDRHLSAGRYQASLRRTVRVLRQRRDALHAHLPERIPDARGVRPHGGLFSWIELPAGVTAAELAPVARAHGVEFASGERFSTTSRADGHVRLNFAVLTPDEIQEGVRRLGLAVDEVRAR